MKTPNGLPSASKLQTPLTCPGAHLLPQVGFASDAGEDGHELHALLNAALDARKAGRVVNLTHAHQSWLDAVLEAMGDRLDAAAQEVAYGYDPTTGRATLYGSHLGRNYPAKPTSHTINGTADYVAPVGDGSEWLVVDLKTGLADAPRVERLWQMRFLALAVAAWHGAESVQVAILHAPRDGQRPWWEWGPTWTAYDLLELQAELTRGALRILAAQDAVRRGEVPHLVQGPHCLQCPARMSCPAQTALVRRMAGEPEAAKRDLSELLTTETAGRAWARREAIAAALKEFDRQLYAFAKDNPFPLPDGRMFGPHRSKGRAEVDADSAHDVLTRTLGQHVADAAMERHTSKTRVLKAVADAAPRGQKETRAGAAWKALIDAGAVTERWRDDVGPYDPHDKTIQSAQPALPATTVNHPAPSAPVLSEDQGKGETT